MKTMADDKLKYIDCLRGIAILMVIIVHTGLSINNFNHHAVQIAGFFRIGVQLFFFMSAYTLCYSMSKRKDSIKNFYIRRYFRIAPLYYFGILIYFLASTINSSPNYNSFNLTNVICHVLLLHGLVPSVNNAIVPGGWSIGTEVLFYLMFPFLFTVYANIQRKFFYWIIPIFSLLLTNSIALILIHFKIDVYFEEGFYYYNIINQLPVFLVGMSFYFLQPSFNKINSKLYFPLFFILFCLAFITSARVFHNRSVFIFIAAISFIFLFLFFKNKTSFNFKILAIIGQLSFSIYVLHFIFCWIFTAYQLNINPYISFIINLILTVGATTIAAWFTKKYIEDPGINLGKRIISRLNR